MFDNTLLAVASSRVFPNVYESLEAVSHFDRLSSVGQEPEIFALV